MKYYVYISDAKVDMLLPQIPNDVKKKIATEFKIDLKILSASRKTEVQEADDRITRLEAVCEYIRNYRNIGSIDEPDEYIDDDLSMKWGSLTNDYGGTNPPLVVYFSGETERTICALGGSMKHVLGNANQATRSHGSHIAGLLMTLASDLKLVGTPVDLLGPSLGKMVFLTEAEKEIQWGSTARSFSPDGSQDSLAPIQMLHDLMTAPPQNVEFLAKRLAFTAPAQNRKAIVLATPLYVALSE